MNRRGWDGDWPPRAKPRRPADGIKAQSKRGAFASGWWAKRWIAVLEAFQLGARLARGRSYARSGQVTQIVVEIGGIRAQVQGSRAKPYDVTIRMRPLEPAEWRAVGTAIGGDVRLAATLLAGKMPEDIEKAFRTAKVSLFPSSAAEMKTACSCPDWSNPCKHVAAVFYLIGEEFDRDPFLLFVVRGLAREAVRDLFSATESLVAGSAVDSRTQKAGTRKRLVDKPATLAQEPLTAQEPVTAISLSSFWGADAVVAGSTSTSVPTATSDDPAVLKRAGKFPFWRGDTAIGEALGPIYAEAAAAAIDWLAERSLP